MLKPIRKSYILLTFFLILFLNSFSAVRAIDIYGEPNPPGAPETPINAVIYTAGGIPLSDEEVEKIHQIANQGVRINRVVYLWGRSETIGYTPLDMFYNETFRELVDQLIDYNIVGGCPDFLPPDLFWQGFDPAKLWGVILGDEEPGYIRECEFYSSLSDNMARYWDNYYLETGFELKPLYEANQTENMVFWEWFIEKNVWAYNHMYDYIKSKWPHLVVFQTTFMAPMWGVPDIAPPYDLKADAYITDCYYANKNPWLLYESIRRYKRIFPTKAVHMVLWGVIWDFFNEPGDQLYYKEGSFEQMRRETWLSYLAGVDGVNWFNWGPQDPNGYDWRSGPERTDILGRQVYMYTNRLSYELAKLPVLKPEPQILAVGEGFQTGQAMPNFVDVGLFSEFDAVNERAFARIDLDLSKYKLIVTTDCMYREKTVRKLNEYVADGGNLMFLGGMGFLENIYANGTRKNLFSIEENTTQSFIVNPEGGHIKINITRPNILDLELDYTGYLHHTFALQIENVTENFHPVGDFYLIEDSTPILLEDYPLLLHHNELNPNSGWILYWGAHHSSQNPEITWETYDSENQTDLWFLHREVFRAFTNFLNISNSISIKGIEKILITQTKLDDGTILAGLANLYPENQSLTYSLNLAPFGLPDGIYWVHSLDANATLGQFTSNASQLAVPVDIVANGTRLFLISQNKSDPSFSVNVFPPVPTPEEAELPPNTTPPPTTSPTTTSATTTSTTSMTRPTTGWPWSTFLIILIIIEERMKKRKDHVRI